ncbi:MAG: homocysteine S-methyltransferase family protein [Candidatus Margulisbacteria bacterium]|nr:homocysteine S-methyltransferase family protein [Candidatus Margulisiibacteriota bacterium]
MANILEELNKRVLVMDGAMGTQLMERGIRPGDNFDLQNLSNPSIVEEVHRAYVSAGADIIETNTFGANRLKLAEYKAADKVRAVNLTAVKLARKAAGDSVFVCGSIGPLGQLIDPLGEVTFDQAYSVFAEQAKAMEEGGADVVSIETISELQEMRAAVIAVKNETKLPVIASLTYDEGEKTIYGTTPEAAVAVLEAIGADVISANCSTGPEGMLKVAKRLLAVSCKPVMVMPNAGMPELIGDKAVYKMSPQKFGAFAKKFAEMGVRIIGGCCGTGPEHIRAIKAALTPYPPLPMGEGEQKGVRVKFASRTRVVEAVPGKLLLIGERINPTGRKLFQAELKQGRMQIVRQEALEQTKNGADLLDTNISCPEIVESKLMHTAVKIVQQASDLPLSIDSPNTYALEEGLKMFCGRALLNSVNGKKESLERILPMAKKYGAAIVALVLDDKGLPQTAEERVRIAERIVQSAQEKGIAKEDIFIDNLVMTVGVGIQGCLETLKAIPLVKERLGVKTILGISNVSHGMPERSKLNALYLQLAAAYGLDAAIVDVTDKEIQKAMKAHEGPWRQKKDRDKEKNEGKEELLRAFKAEVDRVRRLGKPAEKKRELAVKEIRLSGYQDIRGAVVDGNLEAVEILVKQGLEQKLNPQKIINEGLIPGMEIVGKKFSRKEYFLPQVIESAEAMRRGFELCQEKIPKGSVKTVGKVVLATVKGDIHDIGKNIVKMLLENHGFKVIDLGKDVSAETIIAAAKKEKPNAIALSALLTTTMVEMNIVKEALQKAKLNIPLLVGGAVVTKGYADKIGANYSLDAVGAVSLAKKLIQKSRVHGL